jgi:hypothetical protein
VYPRIFAGQPRDHFPRAIARPVVDEDNFDVELLGRRHFADFAV